MDIDLKALELADEVREMMATPGWKITRQILEENIAVLDSLEGVTTLRDVSARQQALKVLRTFLRDLDAIKDAWVMATSKPTSKLKPTIFRIQE